MLGECVDTTDGQYDDLLYRNRAFDLIFPTHRFSNQNPVGDLRQILEILNPNRWRMDGIPQDLTFLIIGCYICSEDGGEFRRDLGSVTFNIVSKWIFPSTTIRRHAYLTSLKYKTPTGGCIVLVFSKPAAGCDIPKKFDLTASLPMDISWGVLVWLTACSRPDPPGVGCLGGFDKRVFYTEIKLPNLQ